MLDKLVVVDHDGELIGRDAAEHACTDNEVDGDALRECAQHLALWHVHRRHRHLNRLLSEDIGIESDAHGVGHNLHALYLLERHGLHHGIVEVGDVDGHGLHVAQRVERLLAAVDGDGLGPEACACKVERLAWHYYTSHLHRHLARQSVVVVEVEAVGLHLHHLRGSAEALVNHLHQLLRRHYAVARLTCDERLEVDVNRTHAFAVDVCEKREAFVAHRDTHGVLHVACYHDVLRYVHKICGHAYLSLVCFVERRHQPEDGAQHEKEEKSQKLPVS